MVRDRKEYFAAYYKKNKGKRKKYFRENYAVKKDRSIKYYHDNKKARVEYQKRYVEKNREIVNEKQRRYRKRLKEKSKIKTNGLEIYRGRIADLEDVCTLYWIVRKHAAITLYCNRRKRYKQLRKDFEELQRMRKAA